MITEFELTLDPSGKPCIQFIHYDKMNDLEQKILKIFIDSAKEKGLKIFNIGGLASTEGESWEKYEIRINI